MNIFLFCAAAIGLCTILVDSTIAKPLRDFVAYFPLKEDKQLHWLAFLDCRLTKWFTEFIHGILSCYMCCGFWAGLVCGFVAFPLYWRTQALCPFAGSCLCYFAFLVMQSLESSAILNIEDDE